MKKRILLTGATGFLGSHLAKALLADGHKIIALKRKSSSLRRIASIAADLELIDLDELDLDRLFLEFGKIDVIIHSATCYGRNGESASEIFSANTEFPLRLLDAGQRAGVKLFLNTDTILDKYLNAYSLSKNQFLQWGKYFSKHKGILFCNLRLEHFYGSDDEPSKFSTYVINGCMNNIAELRLTKGEQKRDFIYIDDVVSAYLILLDRLDSFDHSFIEFDVGTGKSVSIKDFVETVHHITASETILAFGALPYRDGEVMHSTSDISGLEALGWRCQYDLGAGIRKVVEQENIRLNAATDLI